MWTCDGETASDWIQSFYSDADCTAQVGESHSAEELGYGDALNGCWSDDGSIYYHTSRDDDKGGACMLYAFATSDCTGTPLHAADLSGCNAEDDGGDEGDEEGTYYTFQCDERGAYQCNAETCSDALAECADSSTWDDWRWTGENCNLCTWCGEYELYNKKMCENGVALDVYYTDAACTQWRYTSNLPTTECNQY